MQQKPCKPGKVRIDGRCRKPPTGKPPCKPGKVRNPAGRCVKAKAIARKPAAAQKVNGKPPCKPNQVRSTESGRCIDAVRYLRQKAKAAAAKKTSPQKAVKKSSPKKAPSPVKKYSPKPPTPFKPIYGMTIKQTCRATAVNKCRSPCSVIRLPNGKQMCTQVKKPKKLPTKRTMHALARMA